MDMDTSGGGGNSQDMSKRQGLIAVNDLTYVLEPDLSVASNKTHKTHHFQSTEYNHNQAAICILNSGADYIDTRRSWLEFDVTVTAPAWILGDKHVNNGALAKNFTNGVFDVGPNTQTSAYFGVHGSIANIIKSISISTRSGDELCVIEDYNLLQQMLIPLAHGTEWVDGPGQLMGFGRGIKPDVSTRFAIPMYLLSPLFAYGRLMPSMLMSGMRISINWERPSTAFQSIATYVNTASGVVDTFPVEKEFTFVVNSPQFVLSSVQLSDSIQRALNELSATNGLEIVYTDYAHTSYGNNSALTEINTEIRKSCSRALKAFARIRNVSYATVKNFPDTAGIGLETSVDSFRSEANFPFLEYQWQLGSLYFPQQPVSGRGTDRRAAERCAVSAFGHLLESIDKFHDNKSMFCTFNGHLGTQSLSQRPVANTTAEEFNSGATGYSSRFKDLAVVPGRGFGDKDKHGFSGQATTIGVTLERSTMFNLAGVPINNSRVLAFRAKLLAATTETQADGKMQPTPVTSNIRHLNIFLKYVKLARVFMNNVEVEQ